MSLKHLVTALAISMVSTLAFAQEEGNPFKLLPNDVYFQPGGGLRVRYENLRGATGGAFTQDEDESQATHRAQIDFKMYKGEYFETFFRLINVAEWGGAVGDTSGGQHDGFTKNNGLFANQAWALWKFNDALGIRFGRAPLHFGLGYTYGTNDWFNIPYSFDLFDLTWDWESIEMSLVAAKVQELTKVSGETLSSDPEENHIIVNIDMKDLADIVTILDFTLVQINRDLGSPDAGTTVLNGLNVQRLALEGAISGKNIFVEGFVTFVAGEEKIAPVNQVNSIDNIQIRQSAFDLKAGYRFTESNNLRLWSGLHVDSGDEVLGDDQSQSYDSFYYEVYGQAGLMDFLRWGNLSFYRVGLDVELFTGFTLGSEWLSFSKTSEVDGLNFGEAGRFLSSRQAAGEVTLGPGSNVGSEFDIWTDWKFNSGVQVRTTVSTFFPGSVFENATTAATPSPSSTIFQFLTQVGFFF